MERSEQDQGFRLIEVHAGAFALVAASDVLRALPDDDEVFGLLEDAVARALERGARIVHLRTEQTPAPERLAERLQGIGFRPKHERVEFCAEVDGLPDDQGSPLAWTSLAPIGTIPLEEAARILGVSAQGDPDWDPDDDPSELLTGFLAEPGMRGDAACVQIATLADRVAGIVVAQVCEEDGFSRITYMGLMPELRGQGLGQWLHRRGFTMLKAQGGVRYRGGTVIENRRMIRLFEKHGCERLRRLRDWKLCALDLPRSRP